MKRECEKKGGKKQEQIRTQEEQKKGKEKRRKKEIARGFELCTQCVGTAVTPPARPFDRSVLKIVAVTIAVLKIVAVTVTISVYIPVFTIISIFHRPALVYRRQKKVPIAYF